MLFRSWKEGGYVSSSDVKSQEVLPKGRCPTGVSKRWGVSKPIPFWFGGDFLGCARVMVQLFRSQPACFPPTGQCQDESQGSLAMGSFKWRDPGSRGCTQGFALRHLGFAKVETGMYILYVGVCVSVLWLPQ